MSCPNCGSIEVYSDTGMTTIFRCHKCGKVGNAKDFGGENEQN